MIPDDRLRLVFTCCHPALALEAQVALTLRLVCGVETRDVAHAFLVSPSDDGRAHHAGQEEDRRRADPVRRAGPADLPGARGRRLDRHPPALHDGHTAPAGEDLVREDLCARALGLARMLARCSPATPRPPACSRCCSCTRRGGDADGRARPAVRLEDQDRGRWDRALIAEADALVVAALRRRAPRPAGSCSRRRSRRCTRRRQAEGTDWPQIVALYDALLRVWPSTSCA